MPDAPPAHLQPLIALLTRFGIASNLFRSLMADSLSAQGLTVSQFHVLAHLARHPAPQRITDIARVVDVGQPAVTKMLAKFETAGWVVFSDSKGDRRAKKAQVTEQGHGHLRQVQTTLFPGLLPQLLDWPSEDIERFVADLTRFSTCLENIRRLDDDP